MFYSLRFALGVAEAGLYPGALFYLSLWFPQRQQARATGFFTVGSALGNASGALISGPLLDLNGWLGLEGWRWIFLVTGTLPMLAVFLVWRWLVDSPAQANFLTADERQRVMTLTQQGRTETPHTGAVLSVVLHPRVLGFAAVYILIMVALYGVIYWSPSVIKTFAGSGTNNGLLTAAPWLLAAVLLMTVMPKLKQRSNVMTALMVLCGLGCICFALAATVASPQLRFAALLIGTPCISLSVACFWTFPIRMFSGARNATAIAAISTLGSLGGFIAQNLMPALARAGDPAAALWAPSICLLLVCLGSLYFMMAPTAAGKVALE